MKMVSWLNPTEKKAPAFSTGGATVAAETFCLD